MRLIYVDDSGNEECSLLSALIVPERLWGSHLKSWLGWRKTLLHQHGIPIEYEIHSQEWLSKNPVPIENSDDGSALPVTGHSKPSRRDRFIIFEKCLKTIGSFSDVQLLTIHAGHVDKVKLYGELLAWLEEVLQIERDYGLVILDGLDQGDHFRSHHRDLPINTRRIIEDPTLMKSEASQWIQMADVCVHAAFQSIKQSPARDKGFLIAYERHLARIIQADPADGERGIRGAP